MVIEAANLHADLEAVREGLEATGKEVARGENDGAGVNYQAEGHIAAAGQALLLLAHLERQGQADLIRPVLPLALLPGTARAREIDAAIGSMALGRLEELNEQWVKNGDAAKYADGLEALADRFYRGWSAHEGARLLARRVRAAAPAASGLDAASAEAAALLLSLRTSDSLFLLLGRNWVLPPRPESGEEAAALQALRRRAARRGGGPAQDRLTGFFQRRAPAAAALVPLLGDTRVLRICHGETYRFARSGFLNEDDAALTGEAAAERALETLPRPYQMGELAAELLSALLPSRSAFRDPSNDPAGFKADIAEWVHRLTAMSDEQLAWAYLQGANSSDEQGFQQALDYLVTHRSPATVGHLREVLLDPAVWENGSFELLAVALEKVVDQIGASSADFGQKLLAFAPRSLEENEAQGRQNAIPGMTSPDYREKAAEKVKRLEQILQRRR